MVATVNTATPNPELQRPRRSSQSRQRLQGPLQLVQGSLSAGRVERQSPLLAGMHRASNGFLAGLGFCLLGLSGLSLHWQSVFAGNYAQLQASRTLEQKLQESAAILEQHHLGAVRRPGQLVPTSSEKLIHLDRPSLGSASAAQSLFAQLPQQPIPAGY